jgi:hypothetical protein
MARKAAGQKQSDDKPLMTAAELRDLARSYAPLIIKELRELAKGGSTKSVRESARKILASRGISLDGAS